MYVETCAADRPQLEETVVDREENAGSPLKPSIALRVIVAPEHPIYLSIKSFVERVIALTLLLMVSPLLAVLCVLIRMTSSGPALYKQTRLGRGGRSYEMFKLRSMTHNCEAATGAVWSSPNDVRVTRIGRILRDTHLDELPQLWNVVRGEMSMIGPCPERPEIVRQIELNLPHYHDRMQVLPGMTGLAQIQHPADIDLDHVRRKLANDLYYVREASLWLDIRIALGTVLYFTGATLKAIGKMLVKSHGTAAEREAERRQAERDELENDADLQVRAAS